MKSVHFKSNSKENVSAPKKVKQSKKVQINEPKPVHSEIKPGETIWVPSRDWHKYLSGKEEENVLKCHFRKDCHVKTKSPDDKKEELMLKKPSDELIAINLPRVNFCSEEKPGEESLPKGNQPSIADLCDSDKGRIAHLVEELARCKQERLEDAERMTVLKNKVSELKASMRKLLANRNSESKSISDVQSQQEGEKTALKNQLSELNQLIYQMQVQKATSEVQMKTIVAQAEKMTRVIHEMHRENTELKIELTVTKERLTLAQTALERMTKDLEDVRARINPHTEDKACQSADNMGAGDVNTRPAEPATVADDQKILCELFFNKNIQNDFSPKETIIFLSGDPPPSVPKL